MIMLIDSFNEVNIDTHISDVDTSTYSQIGAFKYSGRGDAISQSQVDLRECVASRIE